MHRRFLNDGLISELHNKVSEVLQKVGIRFENEEALELFRAHGMKVDGQYVYFTDRQIEEALACFSSFEMGEITERSVTSQLFYGVPYILDENTNICRNATVADVVKMYKLGETSDLYGGCGIAVVDPCDNDAEDKYLAQIAMMLKYSDKYFTNGFRASSYNTKDKEVYASACKAIELIKEFRSTGEDDNYMNQCVCPMSPLAYDDECILNIKAAVVNGQSVTICPCSIGYLTGPVTIFGLNVHDMAIALAGTVYIQLLRPGTEVYYSVCSTQSDLRTMQPTYGSVEEIFVSVAFYELCLSYKLCSSICAALTDAIRPDYQSGVESALTTLMPFELTQLDVVYAYPGLMSGFSCGSFEKAIYDEELVRVSNRYLKGISLSLDEGIIEDMYKAKTTDTFLYTKSSQRFREDFFMAKGFYKGGIAPHEYPGKDELKHNALNEISRRIDNYVLPQRTLEQKRILNRYLPSQCKY